MEHCGSRESEQVDPGLNERLERVMARLEAWASVASPAREQDMGALIEATRRVSEGYTARRGELGERARGDAAYRARAHFYLPRDGAKVVKPLWELALNGQLPGGDTLRVLDIGAGLGSTSLGVAATYAELHGEAMPELRVDAWEVDEGALRIQRRIVNAARRDVRLNVDAHARDLRDGAPPRGVYDLVVMGLVLNELGESSEALGARLLGLCSALRPGGALIVIEPALREPSRALQEIRDGLRSDAPPYVFAPCPHAGPCPLLARKRDWCHEDLPVALPPSLAKIAKGAGLRFERLTYAYLTLRNEPGDVGTRLRESERDRTTLRVVSGAIRTKGKIERHLCFEGGGLVRRLDREATEANAWFAESSRGDIVAVREARMARSRVGRDCDAVGPTASVSDA